jgi:outer membrane protein assembly factor BamE
MRHIFRFAMMSMMALGVSYGCAREQKPADYRASPLENLPFVYKMTVQQGNILTEEMVDGLTLGMTKRQVNFLLGTPLLSDFFHRERWDYAYTIQRGHQPLEKRFLTLQFQNDALVKIDGDIKPNPQRVRRSDEPKSTVVTVPDYEVQPSLLTRGLHVLGLKPKQ